MIRYLLDTNLLAAFLLGRPGALELVSPMVAAREAATSVLAYGEIVEYLAGRNDFAFRRGQLRQVLRTIRPYFITFSVLERYATIRRSMRSPHGTGLIGDIDTLIAATALDRGLTLVSSDTDFQRVPDLPVLTVPRSVLSRGT